MVQYFTTQTYVIFWLRFLDFPTSSKVMPEELADSKVTSKLPQVSSMFMVMAQPSSYPSFVDWLEEEAASAYLSLDWLSFERAQLRSFIKLDVIDFEAVDGGKIAAAGPAGNFVIHIDACGQNQLHDHHHLDYSLLDLAYMGTLLYPSLDFHSP